MDQREMRCNNCDTDVTPLWRKGVDGVDVCNACGLYYKIHGLNRPKSMKKDEVRQRQRGRKNALSLSNNDSTCDELDHENEQRHGNNASIKNVDNEIGKNKKNEFNRRKGNKENLHINLAEYKRRTKNSNRENCEEQMIPRDKYDYRLEEEFHGGYDYVSMFSSAVNCNYDDTFDYDSLLEKSSRSQEKIRMLLYNDDQLSDLVMFSNKIECTKIEDEKGAKLGEAELLAVHGLLALSKISK